MRTSATPPLPPPRPPRFGEQLQLPLELPGATRRVLALRARDFVTGFTPKLGASFLMRIGVPTVAATTPAVISVVAPGRQGDFSSNLIAGSILGGVWGAAVGAAFPFGRGGMRVPRVAAAGSGAASGVLLAPAVAAVSSWVAERAIDLAPLPGVGGSKR